MIDQISNLSRNLRVLFVVTLACTFILGVCIGSEDWSHTTQPSPAQKALPKTEANSQSTSYLNDSTETKRIGIGDWLTFSANIDISNRNTQFYQSKHDTTLTQWDSRVELWLPPGPDEFSWGPYIRWSRAQSTTEYEWENSWSARPGYGLQMYPFSSKESRESDNKLVQWLGPLHAFIEKSKVRYKGVEHSWRPDYQLRAGVDYWKETNVHNLQESWWSEIWNGLVWYSTNGWDEDYNSLIFANSLRLGIREPNADLLSMFSPYVLAESSLSENSEYFWENRLILGGGVRFSLSKHKLPEGFEWLDRFVIYAEYLEVADYYRSSATSSTPDHDFRFGINIVIGDYWSQY